MTTTLADSTGTTLPVRVFVSHSHRDKEIVEPLVDLLKCACRLEPGAIRATSVDGAQLTVGSDVRTSIVGDLRDAEVTIAVVTPASLESAYVQFELETRHAAKQRMMPIVGPGVLREQLPPQLRDVHWVKLDTGLPALVESLNAALGHRAEPAVIVACRPLIDRVVAAARNRYTDIPVPQLFEDSFKTLITETKAGRSALWSTVAFDGAAVLLDQLKDDSDTFRPDLLIAINEGGMVTSAMLKSTIGARVGVAFTVLQAARDVTSLALPDMRGVRRVLLVDTKLKSGGSVLNVMTELQKRKRFEFRLAVLVDYGPWAPPRWSFLNGARWPAVRHLPGYDLPTYVAYRTAFQGYSDPYLEPWRNDSLVP